MRNDKRVNRKTTLEEIEYIHAFIHKQHNDVSGMILYTRTKDEACEE